MTLVIDSSVAIKWFVSEPEFEHAIELLHGDEPLIAPSLILAEVANAMWHKARVGEITRAQVSKAIEELQTILVMPPVSATLTVAAFEIAQILEHSIYDCMFLACAGAENATLVTADKKFLAKLMNTPFASRVRDLAT